MVAFPADCPVTTPVLSILAIAGEVVDHETGRPCNSFPFASRAIARSVMVDPTGIAAFGGSTVTAATAVGVKTVTVMVALTPSAVAEITVLPADRPVSIPVGEIWATAGLLLFQITARLRTAPDWSRTT